MSLDSVLNHVLEDKAMAAKSNPDQVVGPVSSSSAAVSNGNGGGKPKRGTYKALAFVVKASTQVITDDADMANREEINDSGSGAGWGSSSSSSDEDGPTMTPSQRKRMSTMAGPLSPDHPTQKALRHAFTGWPSNMGPGDYEKRLLRLAETFVERHHLLERYMKDFDQEKKKTAKLNAALNAEVRLHKATLEELTQEATAYESLRNTKGELDLELMDWKARCQMLKRKNADLERCIRDLESSHNKRSKE